MSETITYNISTITKFTKLSGFLINNLKTTSYPHILFLNKRQNFNKIKILSTVESKQIYKFCYISFIFVKRFGDKVFKNFRFCVYLLKHYLVASV